MPPTRTNPIASRMSHLAIYPAMYTLGIYLLAPLAMNLPQPDSVTIVFILLVANACYLLDRVKITNSRQDPADALALPDRTLFFARNASSIRALLVVELLVSIVLGYFISPLLAPIPLGALIGVYLYAGRGATPSDPRFKDLPALKSFFIASAHLAFVIVVLWGNDHDLIAHPRAVVLWSLIGIWLIVSADAILCDLDDIQSDAIYATRSLPVLIGPQRAWVVAITAMLIGVLCLFIRHAYSLPLAMASCLILLSALPTRLRKNRRDLIDARLLPIVLVGILLR